MPRSTFRAETQNPMKALLCFAAGLMACAMPMLTASANNIQVSNAVLAGNNGSSVFIQFDIRWENSWRSSGLPNWDAAWVFVKYRDVSNVWHHVHLSTSGHVVPSGSPSAGVTAGLQDPGAPWNAATNPAVGMFVHRAVAGSGTFVLTGLQLKWDYAAEGVTFSDVDDIGVFGIEMVYVPQGPFYCGSEVTAGLFAPEEFTLINNADPTVEPGAGSPPEGGQPADAANPYSPEHPNGFRGFYCMRYELSQQGYADFLNTLTYQQQQWRSVSTEPPIVPTSSAGGGFIQVQIPSSGGATPNHFGLDMDGDAEFGEPTDGTDLPCGWLNRGDIMAYLDWSGLRPMSSLEYEKACRGPLFPPPTPEFAWGTAAIADDPYVISDPHASTEGISSGFDTDEGNASWSSTSTRRLRPGIFAANMLSTGRVTAGATYYGIMEMSGNMEECFAWSPSYEGRHGDGSISAFGVATVAGWPTPAGPSIGAGMGFRGGSFTGSLERLRVADRSNISPAPSQQRVATYGIRGVRSVD